MTERQKALSEQKEGFMETQVSDIAKLNDAFRRENPAHYVLTSGVAASLSINDVMFAIRHFNDFSEDNDPYGERDFGSLVLSGNKIFWKIDYYDQQLKYWCDPLSPDCNRVLTVMLAEEY